MAGKGVIALPGPRLPTPFRWIRREQKLVPRTVHIPTAGCNPRNKGGFCRWCYASTS
jgi:hypothetical protein